jgi:hemoglobin
VDGSLYERLGGVDAITAVTRAAVDRQMKDDRINQKSARTNVDRLIKEFVDQICQATGGPCTYTGRSMTEAHHNMGVTNSRPSWKTSSRFWTTSRSGKPNRTSS